MCIRDRSYTNVFAGALIAEAERDSKIIAITAAMPSGTGLDKFAAKFPTRTFDVGIAEQHAVTFAAGLATEGMKPFCAIYSTFLQRAFDQVVHDVAIQSLPVRFALDRAGPVGNDGATHSGSFDIAYLGCLPGMVVMAPADEAELVHACLLYTSRISGLSQYSDCVSHSYASRRCATRIRITSASSIRNIARQSPWRTRNTPGRPTSGSTFGCREFGAAAIALNRSIKRTRSIPGKASSCFATRSGTSNGIGGNLPSIRERVQRNHHLQCSRRLLRRFRLRFP